ncbi:MAG TPA: LPXTG cell wall anchor domain-containing protein, partial [Thermoanaerobaculia bacterium]|nr:LPXTG cell wall anchor domain-containing protein [Thermoanaerobaculia bacterium]
IAGAMLAQSSSSTSMEKRDFEIISVDGNKVVVKTDRGVREVTLPSDFKLNMDGKELGLADLKPGMKGSAMVATKTTMSPVVVTEVKNAEVLNVSGNTIIVRGSDGIKKYTVQDVRDRNVSIMREGERVEISQLRPGDRLTATIITKRPPIVTTEQAVHSASVAKPKEPAPAMAPAPAPATAPASEPMASTETKPAKKLPKTGSHLPLAGGLGMLFVAAGATLTALRRRR